MGRLQTAPIHAKLFNTGNLSILNNVVTVVNWNTITDFSGNISPSAANDEIVIDVSGLYLFEGAAHWDGEAASGNSTRRMIRLQRDTGGGYADLRYPSWVEQNQLATSDTVQSWAEVLACTAGEKYRMQVHHGSGSTRTLLGGATGGNTHLRVLMLPMKLY